MSTRFDGEGLGGSRSFPPEIFTGTDKTLALDDNEKFHVMDNTLPMTVTIPLDSTVLFPNGAEMEFLREGTGTLTFLVELGVELDSVNALRTLNAHYSAGTLKKTSPNEWGLIGDLA